MHWWTTNCCWVSPTCGTRKQIVGLASTTTSTLHILIASQLLSCLLSSKPHCMAAALGLSCLRRLSTDCKWLRQQQQTRGQPSVSFTLRWLLTVCLKSASSATTKKHQDLSAPLYALKIARSLSLMVRSLDSSLTAAAATAAAMPLMLLAWLMVLSPKGKYCCYTHTVVCKILFQSRLTIEKYLEDKR